MKQYLLAIAVATLTLTACKRDPEPAPAPEVAPAVVDAPTPEPTAASDATAVIDHAAPAGDATGLDAKAFAGTFSATGIQVTFIAEGLYNMALHDESADTDFDTAGTWTVEADGRHILLDPHSKSETDYRYEVVSMNELRAVDGGQSLVREGTSR